MNYSASAISLNDTEMVRECGIRVAVADFICDFNDEELIHKMKTSLFTAQINDCKDWEKIFQSILAFTPLIEYIFQKENLPIAKIENLTPGTNAVFKSGDYVVKIYAPPESGFYQIADLQTELFAAQRAGKLGISAPKLIADGVVDDKYRFAYMITKYIKGIEFSDAVKAMSYDEKFIIAKKLRNVTDKMNTPCESFNDIDVTDDKMRYRRWDKYPVSFKEERLAYIRKNNFGENVFAHGDLCGDNILLSPAGEIYVIDFADAVLAPIIYEHALLVFTFEFDMALLQGYFGDYKQDEFMEMCFDGLLIHDFGGDIVEEYIGKPSEFSNLGILKEKLEKMIEITGILNKFNK